MKKLISIAAALAAFAAPAMAGELAGSTFKGTLGINSQSFVGAKASIEGSEPGMISARVGGYNSSVAMGGAMFGGSADTKTAGPGTNFDAGLGFAGGTYSTTDGKAWATTNGTAIDGGISTIAETVGLAGASMDVTLKFKNKTFESWD